MAVTYEYTRYKDEHSIENTGAEVLKYVIQRRECSGDIPIAEGTIAIGEIKILPINKVDGLYVVTLNDDDESTVLTPIYQFNNLLTTFIDNIEDYICNCGKGCKDCENECINCDNYLDTLVIGFSYMYAMNTYTAPFMALIMGNICRFQESVTCLMVNKHITGTQETMDLFMHIVAIYYAAFYYLDSANATDESEEEYIKVKYKIDKLFKCFKKKGYDIPLMLDSISG